LREFIKFILGSQSDLEEESFLSGNGSLSQTFRNQTSTGAWLRKENITHYSNL
jgi:hypothetical protein